MAKIVVFSNNGRQTYLSQCAAKWPDGAALRELTQFPHSVIDASPSGLHETVHIIVEFYTHYNRRDTEQKVFFALDLTHRSRRRAVYLFAAFFISWGRKAEGTGWLYVGKQPSLGCGTPCACSAWRGIFSRWSYPAFADCAWFSSKIPEHQYQTFRVTRL